MGTARLISASAGPCGVRTGAMSHQNVLSASSSRKSLRPGTPKRRTSSRRLGASGKTEEVARAAFRLERAGGGGKTPEREPPSGLSPDAAEWQSRDADDADADLVLEQSELEQLKVRSVGPCGRGVRAGGRHYSLCRV